MKERVLRFVENRGSARFTDIQRFIVDQNYSDGTYDKSWELDVVWLKPTKKFVRGRASARFIQVNRGYYCSAFSGPNPYFLYGEDCLKKQSDGKYKTMRGINEPRPPYHSWWNPAINYPKSGWRDNNFRS